MKRFAYVALAAMIIAGGAFAQDEIYSGGTPDAEALGWNLGCQSYSFNHFTFFESLNKIQSMGLTYVEAYPGQILSTDLGDVKMGHDMPKEYYPVVQALLKAKNVNLVNYGVVGVGEDEAESRKVFEFAKAMGIQTINSQPAEETLDLVEKLADEYGINVAFHNHPKPSIYWDYKKVIKECEGRSKRLGACADTGHWMRSDINPLEAVKALLKADRLIAFHIKDLNKYGRDDAHDVPFGQGEADIAAILKTLKDANWKGVMAAEYEHNWDNSVPEISQGMKFVNEVAKKLSK
jgi:sugar phosphate isomerase/epimerase